MHRILGSISAALFAVAVLIPAGVSHAAGPTGTVYEITIPKQGTMYADATYYGWVPDDVGTVRSIIVHQHGCTRERDAEKMMGDVQWLTMAKKWHSVFIAPKLITGAPGTGSKQCSNWNRIENGSGSTFLAALDTLAQRSGHPEIKTVPWALWGHSGGARWIMSMTGAHPERVAVAVAQSSGADISANADALKVPMLHHNGKKDMAYNDKLFAPGREKGALWAHAVNPFPLWANTPPNPGWSEEVFGHAPHNLRMIAIPWMEAGMESRLPAEPGSATLREMDTSHAWLGDNATHAIASEAAFKGDKATASWFPSQSFARKWKEYMVSGTQKDRTPPPAPRNLAGAYSSGEIKLTWDSDADLETGIKTFVIYRNGTRISSLQYDTTTLFSKATGFQRWQDGDEPHPKPAPEMTFTDTKVKETGTYTYQVSTVNWSDLPGPRSAPLVLKRGQVILSSARP